MQYEYKKFKPLYTINQRIAIDNYIRKHYNVTQSYKMGNTIIYRTLKKDRIILLHFFSDYIKLEVLSHVSFLERLGLGY